MVAEPGGAYWTTVPPARAAISCLAPCDDDCYAGPEHCITVHEPSHKWPHARDSCPLPTRH